MTGIKRQHVVIRREDYGAGIRSRPEVGVFTQAHTSRPAVPWDRIAPGDKVWMKWSGGPVVASARVQGFRQIESCSLEALRATTKGSISGRTDSARVAVREQSIPT